MFGKNVIRKSMGKRVLQWRSLPGRLVFVIPISISLLLSRIVFAVPEGSAESEILLLVYAGAACFSAVLFVPVCSTISAQSLSMLLRRCAIVVFVFAVAVQTDSQARTAIVQIAPLALMLFLLMMTVLVPIFAIPKRRTDARQIIFTILAILFALPIWLGPLAEQTGNSPGLTNLIVGASPLSALAVSLDIDYLRTSWFYKNSVLGSLRYDYVSWSAYVIILTVVIMSFTSRVLKTMLRRVLSSIG